MISPRRASEDGENARRPARVGQAAVAGSLHADVRPPLSLTQKSAHSKSPGWSLQLQPKAGWGAVAWGEKGGLPSPSPNRPAHGPATLEDAGSLLQEPALPSVLVDFLYTYRRGKNDRRQRAYDGALPPLPPRTPAIPRWHLAAHGSYTYFEGEAGRLLHRRVNVLIKSWSELVSAQSQMCLTACN